MLRLVIRARMSQLTKPRDQQRFAKSYSFYDKLIKEFNESNGKVETQTMKGFLNNIISSLTRRQIYVSSLTNIFKSSIHHFVENFDFYKKKNLFWGIMTTYQNLNLHRKEIFNLAERYFSQDGIKSKHLYPFYFAIVDLHHKENPKLKKMAKENLLKIITQQTLAQQNIQNSRQLMFAMKVLNIMLMDPEIDLNQCQTVLNSIESNIFPKMKNISLMEGDNAKTLALAKELIYFHKLTIKNEKFYQMLDSALIFSVDYKMQISRPITKRQNYEIQLEEGKEISFKGSKTYLNKNQINHGEASVFETIFSRYLDDFGYDYEKNALIGFYEYDFRIKGKKSKKYYLFENMNQEKEFKPISPDQWMAFKSMDNYDHINIDQKWSEQVILNLNGPYHYIDSDVYGNKRVTRTDEIKMMLLKNYGYERYNQVYYAEWEYIHDKGVMIEQYIDQLIRKQMVV